MPRISPSQLVSGALGGAFYLHGPDRFTKERAALALAERHLDPGTRDFNFDQLRGKDTDVETLASMIATPPMMAEWRVVMVREAEALAGSPKARKVLIDAAKAPPPGLALIIVATVPKGSSARFYKDLAKFCGSTEFTGVSDNDLPGWIMSWAREHYDADFKSDAARALAAGVGGNLGILDREIAKLSGMVETGPVTARDVERAGMRLPKQDRWRWFDMVGERRFHEARRALPTLFEQGDSGVSLVIGLTAHLLRLGVLVSGGRAALEQVLPRHQQWLAKSLGRQAKGWDAEELGRALEELCAVDQLLKASPLPDHHFLATWLLSLASMNADSSTAA